MAKVLYRDYDKRCAAKVMTTCGGRTVYRAFEIVHSSDSRIVRAGPESAWWLSVNAELDAPRKGPTCEDPRVSSLGYWR